MLKTLNEINVDADEELKNQRKRELKNQKKRK